MQWLDAKAAARGSDSWQNTPINQKAGSSYPQNQQSEPQSRQTPFYSEVP
jgi:hypothetical protein